MEISARGVSMGGWHIDLKVLTNEEQVWLMRDVNSLLFNLPTHSLARRFIPPNPPTPL